MQPGWWVGVLRMGGCCRPTVRRSGPKAAGAKAAGAKVKPGWNGSSNGGGCVPPRRSAARS